MKSYIIRTLILVTITINALVFQSCESHLDVVPDNVATIDNAFTLRNEAEKYLFTCYSYLPQEGDIRFNIGMLAGDEMWKNELILPDLGNFEIAKGNQNVGNPEFNVWDGTNFGAGPDGNYNIYQGIRNCNIFIENLEDETKVRDLPDFDRSRWIAEAKFLKAYYHYYLMRMYGPIPIIDQNIPIEASTEEINVYREPVDEVVNFIVNLLDESAADLPEEILDTGNELGRITKPIALGIKAEVLLLAASPLFNGNPDYAGFVDNRGTQLVNTTPDPEKWKLAADAALEAIQVAEGVGAQLYEFEQNQFDLSDTTLTKLSYSQAFTERWNSELIWSNPNSRTTALQYYCMVPVSIEYTHTLCQKILSPPIKIAKEFHTKNGVPIDEDKTLSFTDDTELKVATSDDRYNILEGYRTARLNFDREPRFYASLAFDGSTFYKQDSPSRSDEDTWVVRAKYDDYGGSNAGLLYNVSGYYIKKLVDWRMTNTTGTPYRAYAWPMLRLSDLYLMYAEALNEYEGPTPTVLDYVDRIRERSGLGGVAESWTNFSRSPSKYTTKEGMRDIIQQERLIEFAFEGERFWDLRRWKRAVEEFNKDITGWNYLGDEESEYYQIRTLYQQRFVSPRDYLWPISENSLLQNPNLVQNPGW
ncbi:MULTISPECIES: RagB/SusD family nutrient uptake outer membrane protein [unclassified Leeuwenhoekiella]|uniref:RagB/SusD family nutrient uptake outer membrane protein n=1 Tax=unclassified Leeuwenhoekiella TaxID=2615029 RepID=UPI000C528820|nr:MULTISPECIES: RagB/SusD family nutrient uptake outer membrane protein [unclassified Leeuwenhoekiella]MAW94360.1 RagB/SusD family nutrient uptake outer membrane protein [Leeuwenhoekiella sp.]MBA81036.1 RagB/SusD family nutrient uptake outer membrane protein [Leeuwenhoekiella sp.]|tara:strand:- start:36423 stop:38357 length:1935 start_codon:yes stop_codon:yes gene_type:complete